MNTLFFPSAFAPKTAMSIVSMQTLKKNIGDGIKELCEQFSLEGDTADATAQLHATIEKIMYDRVAPLFESVKKAAAAKVDVEGTTTKKSSDKEKKSKVANHYATFHSQCSKNGKRKLKESPPEMTFRFLEEPRELHEKQQALFEQIVSDAELYPAFASFETVDIHEAVEFVESHLKIDQMTRTAMLWSQFINEEDQKKYIAWHKSLKDEILASKASPPKPKAAVRIKAADAPVPVKINLPVPKINGQLKAKVKIPEVKAPVVPQPVDSSGAEDMDASELIGIAVEVKVEEEPIAQEEVEQERIPTPPPAKVTSKEAQVKRPVKQEPLEVSEVEPEKQPTHNEPEKQPAVSDEDTESAPRVQTPPPVKPAPKGAAQIKRTAVRKPKPLEA